MMEATVDAVEPIKRPRGRPRKRPAKLHTDKAYDAAERRRALRRRGITPRIARRGIESSERLGRYRWVVERTHSWLNRYRAVLIRWCKKPENFLDTLHFALALITYRATGLTG